MSKVLIEVLVIILIAGSYLILYSAVRVSGTAMERTIRVTGKGNLSVKPDTVRLIMIMEGVKEEYESYQAKDKSWKRRFEGYKYVHRMKIEFPADNKQLGKVLYKLGHSPVRPEF